MRALILSGYGINCEEETFNAFKIAGIKVAIVHINDLIDNPKKLKIFHVTFSKAATTSSNFKYAIF